MLTFKQYLLEDSNVISETEMRGLCAKFIKESGGLPLYRGSNRRFNDITLITTRKDRRPSLTRTPVHQVVDDWFNEHYGFRPRSAGLFSIGSMREAGSYGAPHFVLPVGDFKYVWGKYKNILGWGDLAGQPILDTYEVTSRIRGEGAAVDKVMSSVEWSTTNLKEAISTNAEITLLCDQAVMVPINTASFIEPEDTYKQLVGN